MPSLIATLGLNASQFNAALGRAKGQAATAGAGITGALGRAGSSFGTQITGMVGIAGMGAMVKKTLDWAGALQDASDGLNVTTDFLQEMQNGAMTAGGKLEDVQTTLLKIAESRQAALDSPDGTQAAAFGRMGITRVDLESLDAESLFRKVIDAFKGGMTEGLQNDLKDVGGKSGASLLAAFANGFQSNLPRVSADVIAKLDEIGDQFANLGRRIVVGLAPAIAALLPVLDSFGRWVSAAAAYWATLFRTGSLQAAEVAAVQSDQSWDAQSTAAREAAAAARAAANAARNRRQTGGRGGSEGGSGGGPMSPKPPGWFTNSLQQIGAYSARPTNTANLNNPLALTQVGNLKLESIRVNTQQANDLMRKYLEMQQRDGAFIQATTF